MSVEETKDRRASAVRTLAVVATLLALAVVGRMAWTRWQVGAAPERERVRDIGASTEPGSEPSQLTTPQDDAAKQSLKAAYADMMAIALEDLCDTSPRCIEVPSIPPLKREVAQLTRNRDVLCDPNGDGERLAALRVMATFEELGGRDVLVELCGIDDVTAMERELARTRQALLDAEAPKVPDGSLRR